MKTSSSKMSLKSCSPSSLNLRSIPNRSMVVNVLPGKNPGSWVQSGSVETQGETPTYLTLLLQAMTPDVKRKEVGPPPL